MADCRFELPIPSNIGALLERARDAIGKAGGTLEGDERAGIFSGSAGIGKLRGRYTVTASAIVLEIDEKPWIVPCSKIEEAVRGFFT